MKLTWNEIQQKATLFSKKWQSIKGRERQQAQQFIREFLAVFGIEDPLQSGEGEFEYVIKGNYIDYLWKKRIAIEMKGQDKDKGLKKAFSQTREKYMPHLTDEEFPDLWMLCDFENIHITNFATGQKFNFKTSRLRDHIKRFADIAGYKTEHIRDAQVELSGEAAKKMAKLHNALKDFGYEGHDMEVYLTRLLFCMFADDTSIFVKDSFYNYIEESKEDGSDLCARIFTLFDILNTPNDARAKRPHQADLHAKFKYINGALFQGHLPPIAFDAKVRKVLLECINFDWSSISPAIFGAMFQGVMDEKQRREMGAHYTSEENILKLINPLFLDDLKIEFERVKTSEKHLDAFHNKIASLKFLDPACGCGNFLIITYRELRLLELEALKMKVDDNRQRRLDISELLKVNIEQFYGIEYENFPCQIAQVGMWLVDHQMNLLFSDTFGEYHDRLPLTQSATIVHANALRIDWEDVMAKDELDYILGNPPFVGASMMTKEQKADAVEIFGKIKLSNSVDYVGAWFHKSAAYIQDTSIRVGLVSTSSITQGEQVAPLWGKMFGEYGISIDFAYRTFEWGNDAAGKANVYCVIIGFSKVEHDNKVIYDGEEKIQAKNINGYLVDAPNVSITSRSKPLCDVPAMSLGNKPTDGGNLILTLDEKVDLLEKEPISENFVKIYLGAVEFLNGKERFCLWLKDAQFSDLKKSPMVLERIESVRQFRLASSAKPTRGKAETPHLFFFTSQPENDYLAIPEVSSGNRKYLPIGWLSKDIIASNKLLVVPQATLYHFGILTSNVHMTWMRAVTGYLGTSYQYSGGVVYNNFPWSEADDKQKAEIEKLAQKVLDSRAKYSGSTLADMYKTENQGWHQELWKAHRNLDAAIMELYGFPANYTEAQIVASLMEMYQKLTLI
ncbi:MAG: N-6 DNA methylase [Defluviitaleaceae bacterium]|nr:N-6 DNA methylase [Defluviitaleaceae bacterium]